PDASNSPPRVTTSNEESDTADICRVCRSAGEAALYHPCLCTGSIKYVHQECLLEWLKYSKKEVCELCSHKYSFQPIYRSDMPSSLPFSEIVKGITWAIYALVFIAWLGVVPLTAMRIYRTIFAATSVADIFALPFHLFSMENILFDCFKGCFIVSIFLCTFISLVWLREQINNGGPQEWLNLETPESNQGEGVRLNNGAPNVFEDLERRGGNLAGRIVEEGQGDVAVQEQGDADNWRDWERVADELTWQRLLGLDGSLLFLEHVFWVIALNAIFTLCFAFLPFHLGNTALKFFGFYSSITYFPTPIAILLGYVIVSFAVVYRMLGMCYLMLKVFLLMLVEIGFFPVICGWWLDVCSLPLFATTLTRRMIAFTESPYTSVFMHWLFGMVYVFYSSSFVLILREVLRPGVLWFLRNLNDPDFNPIQEMIDLPVARHMRRLIASICLFFTTIILVVYVPLCIISRFFPFVLPFNFTLASETPLGELSVELLVLQIVLPALLEQTHARNLLKVIVLLWCKFFGRLLSLEHYLLPEENASNPPRPVQLPPADGGGLAAQHQALLHVREPQGPQSYSKPKLFGIRIFAILVALSVTSVCFSTVFYVVPATLGRYLFLKVAGLSNVHEFYTVLIGMYVCFLALKSVLAVVLPVLVVIPLLTGMCFQLSVINALRISNFQSALFFPWQHWAMGILQWKLFCALVAMGPEWWLKIVFNRDGIRGLRLTYLYEKLVAPILASLSLFLSVPYVFCGIIARVAGLTYEEHAYITRLSYPCILFLMLSVQFLYWQCTKIKALELKIRNDKYLVQTRLVNYERKENVQEQGTILSSDALVL
ncbi:unnamed protein product, partial [Enterobius vermicularis]|uniref:RING-type E3 ubiquitin transferase n=1 Tax=Enterobius vermicularis TaxID=51028 RepID=A0A0N4UXT6_ENTVE